MKLGNVLAKGLKGVGHGVIGALAFGLFTAAHYWSPETASPAVALAWQAFGIGAAVGLSQAVGRLVSYDPAKDPRNPANAPK